ncbi:hypothetical protein [Vallitalea okinawensis]|uniref:hypothetical protein n=1 Tax=Vallitalea okinawensis TaxID=2078660 RepID=UPI000CFD3BF2|nr:hypothetical protein [Vallitalea okinawensis]
MVAIKEQQELNSSNKLISYDNLCVSTCPECGGAIYFTKTGCFCRSNFDHNCQWNCEKCNPRSGACK